MTDKEFKKTIIPLMDQWFRFSLSMLGDKEEAEDIVQDTITKLWILRSKFSNIDNKKSYALQVVKNSCYDSLKLKKRKAQYSINTKHLEGQFIILEDEITNKDDLQLILKLANTLPIRQREIFILKDIEEYSYDEIVSATNLSISNVRANLSIARKKIRQLFNTIENER